MAGPLGGQHHAVIGDVRLTVIDDCGSRRAIYAVRRRAARTPAQMADLAANLTAAADLLRPKQRQARVLGAHDRRGLVSAALAPV